MKLLLPEFGLLIWTLVAFLVVFFILKKFAWPAIVKGLARQGKIHCRFIVYCRKSKTGNDAVEK